MNKNVREKDVVGPCTAAPREFFWGASETKLQQALTGQQTLIWDNPSTNHQGEVTMRSFVFQAGRFHTHMHMS